MPSARGSAGGRAPAICVGEGDEADDQRDRDAGGRGAHGAHQSQSASANAAWPASAAAIPIPYSNAHVAGRIVAKEASEGHAQSAVGEVLIDGQARGKCRHYRHQEGDAERAEIADRADGEMTEKGGDLIGVRTGHGWHDEESEDREEERRQLRRRSGRRAGRGAGSGAGTRGR